jgi:hypothetical protein
MIQRFYKVKPASKRAGVCERKFRDFLRDGMRHIRLPSGMILIKDEWIDQYLEHFEVTDGGPDVDRIVDEVCKAINT